MLVCGLHSFLFFGRETNLLVFFTQSLPLILYQFRCLLEITYALQIPRRISLLVEECHGAGWSLGKTVIRDDDESLCRYGPAELATGVVGGVDGVGGV